MLKTNKNYLKTKLYQVKKISEQNSFKASSLNEFIFSENINFTPKTHSKQSFPQECLQILLVS